MEDLEITSLPTADPASVSKLCTIGYYADYEGTASGRSDSASGELAAQVRLSDLVPRIIKAASIDFLSGLFISRQPFVAGTSEVYVNGLRYTLGKDYKELVNDNAADGFELPGIESSDEIILKAVVITN